MYTVVVYFMDRQFAFTYNIGCLYHLVASYQHNFGGLLTDCICHSSLNYENYIALHHLHADAVTKMC